MQRVMTAAQIEEQVLRAVNDWAPYLPFMLKRTPYTDTADIKITFEYRDHGDGYEFDGPGGVVGHAFAPVDGRVHIDADEIFTSKYDHNSGQFNLRFVVAHELGHAIGLSHSPIRGSIMFPFYSPLSEDYKITIDDQNAVRALYGIRRDLSEMNLKGAKPWCSSMLDAAATGPGGTLYIFAYDTVFRFKSRFDRVRRMRIGVLFPQLVNNVMAAVFSEHTGSLYFFNGWRMWKYIGATLQHGYPRMINGELAPFNPHGAIYHRKRVFLLKGNMLYEFDEQTGAVPGYSAVFPVDRLILGAPHNISRLFTHRSRHFILTDNYVYAYDSLDGVMLDGYPRVRQSNWLLC